MKKRLFCMILSILLVLLCLPENVQAAPRVQKTKSPVIVVLDPGHGGENDGTTECGFLEREMTLTTAKIMAEELRKFEGITVYLTRETDVDLSLKDRAKFAAEKKADFLISLHYNASESHYLFGSEVWISLNPEYSPAGYQLGTCFLREFRDMGLSLRGIKTKRHSKGSDYYGILREAVNLKTNAIIVEHCHVDHAADNGFCDSQEDLEAFAKADARAVAKYFGLKSSSLGIDYSAEADNLPEVELGTVDHRAMQDASNPEYCHLSLDKAYYDEDRVEVTISGKDSDTNLIYYAISYDGGKTFGDGIPWPEGDILTGEFAGTFKAVIPIPDGTKPNLCVSCSNPYDLNCISNVLTFDQVFQIPEEPSAQPSFEDKTDNVVPELIEEPVDQTASETILQLLMVGVAVVAIIFIPFLIAYLVVKSKKNKEE